MPCSFTPKLVIFKCHSQNAYTTEYGVIYIDTDNIESYSVGGLRGFGASTNNRSGAIATYSTVPSAGKFKYEDGNIYICRQSASVQWSNSEPYTFEIYG